MQVLDGVGVVADDGGEGGLEAGGVVGEAVADEGEDAGEFGGGAVSL